ncbi:MAG: MBL fold metallo-hydrolase [Bacteroidaceae bacterium]|nr:MBL fold metallo-hydrolase [Bacteroidaceae bacterium]
MLKFRSLGSGSSGNCYLLQSPEKTILIDAGLGIRIIKKTLKESGVRIENIDAVFVTHDHADHIKAVGHLANDYDRLIYATELVHSGINRNYCVTTKITDKHRRFVYIGDSLQLGDLTITPFPVPHDSTECVGYRIECDGTTFCLATDVGAITPAIEEAIYCANYLVLESNYDEKMLAKGNYPEYLKGRITSGRGHLSNNQCAEALANHASPNLKHVWLCHVSDENNHPELPRYHTEAVLRSFGIIVGVDFQLEVLKRKTPSQVFELQ